MHHPLAHEWFARTKGPFATCAVTEGTLLRLHMKVAEDGSASAAWGVLRALHEHPRHVFWEEGLAYVDVPPARCRGPGR